MDRRRFLKSSPALAAALPYVTPSSVLGANDRLKLGFIGVGGRASWLIRHEEFPQADIVAVADCAPAEAHKAAKIKPSGERWKKYFDYRRMLEDEKLDAVFVETTTHARVLIMIHAMQAGLDVYGEKPLTLTIGEGRVLANAARRYKRILQTGTQQRSIPVNAWASRRIREGLLGKVHTVVACNFRAPAGWYAKPAQKMPEGMDWDQWCNQTPLREFHQQLQNRWAWYWDYDGGGQSWGVTGWGAHSYDQVQCALGTDDTGPVEMEPESWQSTAPVTMRYANGTVLKLNGPERDHADLGAIFIGEKGKLEIKRGTCVADPPELLDGAPPDTPEGPGENRYHIGNFLDCIRTRKQPNAHVEAGHRASVMCHLVNITRDLGRKLRWDPKAERFIGDDQANSLISRPRRKGYELPKIS
ncbi:MAG: Gfo/Idh/MocA family oxidoreductase [bacterium]|nr:Gfo/Idh/MocA family oxidoreductase [bacterium]